jgi:hypothetical protein
VSPGGGSAAARGFRYQYLRTLEALLPLIEVEPYSGAIVHVDDPPAR